MANKQDRSDSNRRSPGKGRGSRPLSDVSDGGAPQSAGASGDGAIGGGPRVRPRAESDRGRGGAPDMSHLGYGKGSNRPGDRAVDTMRDEDIIEAAATPDDTPPGAAGSRRTNRRENTASSRDRGTRGHGSLDSGAEPNAATNASRPMAGTSRRTNGPGSGPAHRGYESVGKGARDPESTQPRHDSDIGRETHPMEGDKRPRRGLFSRLNPFSRHS